MIKTNYKISGQCIQIYFLKIKNKVFYDTDIDIYVVNFHSYLLFWEIAADKCKQFKFLAKSL